MNGATHALVKPGWEKCTPASMTARVVEAGDTLHKVYLEECLYTGDDSTCSPSEKEASDREAEQPRRDGPEGDHGSTIDVTSAPHHDI